MSKNNSIGHNYKISNLRAFAILVVVFGHSIIIFDGNWNYYSALYSSDVLEVIKHIINLFQMQLFIFISGYCFYYSRNGLKQEGYYRFIKKKAKRLLIPFVVFALFWMIPIRMIAQYPYWSDCSIPEILLQIITGKDSGHLWFCPALFIIMVIAGIIELCVSNKNIPKYVSVLFLMMLFMVSVVSIVFPGIFFIRDVAKYTACFYLGYYMNSLRKDTSKWMYLEFIISALLISISVSGLLNNMMPIKIIVDYIGALLLIVSAFYLAPKIGNRVVERVSKDSFGIYLFHSPMLYIVFCYFSYLRPAVMVSIDFFVLLALSLIMTELLRKSKYMRIAIGE